MRKSESKIFKLNKEQIKTLGKHPVFLFVLFVLSFLLIIKLMIGILGTYTQATTTCKDLNNISDRNVCWLDIAIKQHIFRFFIAISFYVFHGSAYSTIWIVITSFIQTHSVCLVHAVATTCHARREGTVVFVAGAGIVDDLLPLPLISFLRLLIPLTLSAHATEQGTAATT